MNSSANLRQVDCLVLLEFGDLLKLALLLEKKLGQDVVCCGLEIIVHVKGLQLAVKTETRCISAKVLKIPTNILQTARIQRILGSVTFHSLEFLGMVTCLPVFLWHGELTFSILRVRKV